MEEYADLETSHTWGYHPKELKTLDKIQMQIKYRFRKWRDDVLGGVFH